MILQQLHSLMLNSSNKSKMSMEVETVLLPELAVIFYTTKLDCRGSILHRMLPQNWLWEALADPFRGVTAFDINQS